MQSTQVWCLGMDAIDAGMVPWEGDTVPWEGPAALAFTDGIQIGSILDRNGLRPARYVVTRDDRVIMASEVGAIEIPEEDIVRKGRLRPGRMFLVDTRQGRIIDDQELKSEICNSKPYREWLDANSIPRNHNLNSSTSFSSLG